MNGPQWIVLFTLSFFIGVGLFLIFRWLYKTQVDTQTSLIELKDKTIEHYKNIHKEQVIIKRLSDITPDNWQPYLKQPFNLLEDFLEQEDKQQQLNRITADMGFILDAELYILYLEACYSLPPNSTEKLKEEQESWLKQRRKHCENSVESHGGTLAPFEYGLAFIEFTDERIGELKQRFNKN